MDVKQEKRIDDFWNIDWSRDLSDVVRGEINKKTADTQARSSMARALEINGKARQAEGEAKWSNEKLHLENARKLRGIYFIDPEDNEFKETIKNARNKLETSVAPATPFKIMKKELREWWIQQN